ncbi:hypothetical protein [Mycobacterium decipiens]|uniref:Uncharacterized protein n=1 Tax=Mycobacterium decipiens TaxID=1430326 RepID=A0A1X2LU20_9MYCO|nr:hypothetical protein [Mycobacterium decipiens]OSC40313.1 hypothetical protein B8W66_13480 [Mycobacterium decipiens]
MVLLPELAIDRRPRFGAACAKYGKHREICVPPGALDVVDTYLLMERPEVVAASVACLTNHCFSRGSMG